MTQRNTQSGFTLIEILVVIVLVSLIMGIGVIGVRGSDRRVLSMSAEDLSQTIAKAAIVARDTAAPVALIYTPGDAVSADSYYLASAQTSVSLGWFDSDLSDQGATNSNANPQSATLQSTNLNPLGSDPAALALNNSGESKELAVWTPIAGTQTQLIKGVELQITSGQELTQASEPIGVQAPLLSWSAAGITQSAEVAVVLGESSLNFTLEPNSRLRPPQP